MGSMEYLKELMRRIHTAHLDMGGRHIYTIDIKGHELISEIKAWLSKDLGD